MKNLIIFFILIFSPFCHCNTIKNRLQNAKQGDYLVLQQKKIITILRIADITKSKLVIEEISAPVSVINNLDWQKWLSNNAKGNTSWVMFEIDLLNNELIETFSFSKKAWLDCSQNNNLIISLLKNPLKKISLNERKKVGSPPLADEIDRRAIWNPPMKIQGIKVSQPKYDVYRLLWPKDNTELSEKVIQLYFDQKKEFFFPFWIDLIGEHLSLSFKVIDAGHLLSSPKKDIPYRPLEFFLKPKINEKGLSFYLICPKYYRNFEVFAVNYLDENKSFIKIPFLKKNIRKDKVEILLKNNDLKKYLKDNSYYTWFIKPINSKTILEWKDPLFIK